MPSSASTKRVFISATSGDAALAERLKNDLIHYGYSAQTASGLVKPGDDLNQLFSEIRRSDTVIVLISKASDASKWVESEISFALYEQMRGGVTRIIPVVTEEGSVLPPLLAPLQYIKMYGPVAYYGGLQELLAGLEQRDASGHKGNTGFLLRERHDALVLEKSAVRIIVNAHNSTLAVIAGLVALVILMLAGLVLGFLPPDVLIAHKSLQKLASLFSFFSSVTVGLLGTILGYYFGLSSKEEAPRIVESEEKPTIE